MDRLVSIDTKELLLHYSQGHRHPAKQGAKPSGSSPPQHRRRRQFHAAFRLTNLMHTMSVAVHLSTTRPSSFFFSPTSPLAILPPLSSSSFSLRYAASGDGDDDHDAAGCSSSSSSPPLASPPDAVVVRSVMLPTGKADATHLLCMFSGPPVPQIFSDARIPIYFVGPDALLALLRSPSSFPSSAPPLTLETAFLLSKAAAGCSPLELSALLLRAAAAGNPHFVSALLDAGAEPNHRDGAGESALSIAVDAGSVDTVEVLLRSGAVVDPAHDRLIVHKAAARNRVDLIGALVESAGAAWWTDSTDSAGRTPLHVAAAHGHLEATWFCLSPSSSSSSGGCDPDRADARGWTPLHHAAAGGVLEVASLLLRCCSYAAKYALTADTRKTPFDLAVDAAGGAHDDARPLFSLLRLDDLLHRAAAAGDAGGVRSCLARGAAVDGRDQNGWTPLHRAAFKGRAEVAEVLIEHGAEVDAADGAGWTPLRCAAEAGRDEVALLLVARGAARTGLKGLLVKSDTIPGPTKSPDILVGCCVPSDTSIPVLDSNLSPP